MSVIAFKIYNEQKVYQGEIRSISSAQWLEIFDDVGELKLICGISENNKQMLKCGYFIQNTNRPHLLAQICQVIADDDAKVAKYTVRAKMTVSMWDERVLMFTVEITDCENGMLQIAEKNCRDLDCFISPPKGIGSLLTKQISWGTCLDAFKKIAQETNLGFLNKVDSSTLQETFEIFKGVDRTNADSDLYVGYIGRDSGTLGSLKLTDSNSDFKNVAIVAGEGEGEAQIIERVDLTAGEKAKEIYVDARNISRKYTLTAQNGTTSENTHTEAEYRQLLAAEGVCELSKNKMQLDINAQLHQRQIFVGDDYDLGDILPLPLPEYGLYIKVRIQKLLFVEEANKSSVTATLKNMEVLKI